MLLTMFRNLIITPVEMIFDAIFCYLQANPGIAIIAISIVMNFLALPLYQRADAIQEEENNKTASMAKWVNHIKKTFKGDERYMMLTEYYRVEHYKPIFALKSLLPLLLQIPFFIAAYHYLSTQPLLSGASFLFLKDLGKPDQFLRIGTHAINIMPIVMTLINVISAYIYLRGTPLKDKIQTYGIAAIFLVLLYNSPSGLVFYWTLNQVFSVAKNVFMKLIKRQEIRNRVFAIGGGIIVLLLIVLGYLRTPKQLIFGAAVLLLCCMPLIISALKNRFSSRIKPARPIKTKFFLISALFVSLLMGATVPLRVIYSGSAEIASQTMLAVNNVCVFLGFFVVWLGIYYFLSKTPIRNVFTVAVWLITEIFLVSWPALGGAGGVRSSFIAENAGEIAHSETNIKLLVLTFQLLALLFLFKRWKKRDASYDKPIYTYLICFFAFFTIIIFNIFEAFFHNASDFEVVFSDIAPFWLIVTVLLSLLCGSVILLLQKLRRLSPLGRALLVIAVGTTVAAWVQLSFLNASLPSLDGTAVEWKLLSGPSVLSIGAWLLCIALAFFSERKIKNNWTKYAVLVLTVLIVLQVGMLATLALSADKGVFERENDTYYINSRDQFGLSSEENVIILTFDGMSNKMFEEAVDTYSKNNSVSFLNDFTEYANADSAYLPTFPSVLHLMTGNEFDLKEPINDITHSAWTNEQTERGYSLLHDSGYQMNVYGITELYFGNSEDYCGKFSNVEKLTDEAYVNISYKRLASAMGSLALYRVLPFPAKQVVFSRASDQSGIISIAGIGENISGNVKYYNVLTSTGLSVYTEEKLITYQHLYGMHLPYVSDQNCKPADSPSASDTALGCLLIMNEYIDQLKKLDIYDSATIFIIADHGSVDAENGTAANCQPVFLVKQKQETHDSMQVNAAPISYHDFFWTLLSVCGVDTDSAENRTIFEISEDESRTRQLIVRDYNVAYPPVFKYGTNVPGKTNIWNVYEYTGNRSDLAQMIDNGIVSDIIPMYDAIS